MDWRSKTVVVTGATGSLGRAVVLALLERDVVSVRAYSRDEMKQAQLRKNIRDERLRMLIGDVRDLPRLCRAFAGADIVIHLAALKQIPAAENDPTECIKTNVIGAMNVLEAAIDCQVSCVVGTSTDKAASAVTTYGASKFCMERLFVAGNVYAGGGPTKLSCCRWGNVIGSRGSVVHVWQQQQADGEPIEITDADSTRFWITLPATARFILGCVEVMHGAEVFIPELSASRIVDLAEAVAPGTERRVVGLRSGEKRHEVLISPDEIDRAWSFVAPDVRDGDTPLRGYLLWPTLSVPGPLSYIVKRVPPDFAYSSDRAPQLGVPALRRMIEAAP